MKNIVRIIFLCLLCIIPSLIRGEINSQFPDRELSWKNVNIGEGVTTVYSLFRDSGGILWLGTDKGLFFYDGVMCQGVGFFEIGEFQVHALTQKDDKIYIGTNNGLYQFDYFKGNVSRVDAELPGEIRTLLICGDDLWIGSIHGIYVYNIISEKIENLSKGLPNKSVYSILRDTRGILYAGTYTGLARWDSIDRQFHSVVMDPEDKKNTFFVNCLMESDDLRSIYVGGSNSLMKYTPSTDHWEKSIFIDGANVKSLSKNSEGHLIVGTDEGLFDYYDSKVKHYRHDSRNPQSISNNEIWSILSDDEGNVLAGHERGFSIASNSEIFKTYTLGQLTGEGEGNEIYKILKDRNGQIWMGGSNGVILLDNRGVSKWFRHDVGEKSISHNRIRDIIDVQDGSILLATDGGLNVFEEDKFRNYHIEDTTGNFDANWAYSIIENNENIIVGSYLGGLLGVKTEKLKNSETNLKADISINSFTHPWLKNNFVNKIEKDGKGNIWVLLFRDNTLTKFSPNLQKIADIDIYGLTGGYPTQIISDKRGRIWCGFKGGTIVFESESENRRVDFLDSGSDETVVAMGKVGNDLWVSTRSNLWKINGENYEVSLLPFPQQGYSSIYEDPMTGKVLLGGIDHIVEVDSSVTTNINDYGNIRMIVENNGDGVWRFNHLTGEKQGLHIPYGGSLSLLVSTLNYTPGVQPRYMYKLSASSKDTIGGWRVLQEGTNMITLSDIKWGDYTLFIKTEGNKTAPFTLPISVAPPAFLSWWAITLYIVIILFIISGIVYYLNNKRHNDLEIQRREADLKNVERKLTFLSSISHDLKTPLSMIIGPVSMMKEKAHDPEMQRGLENVYRNAVKLNSMIHKTIELQQMTDAGEELLIVSKIELVEFCKGIFSLFEENHPDRKFVFYSSLSKIFIEGDAVKLESIVTNLLSNACKYSFSGSTVSMSVSLKMEKVIISVADDGVGIEDKEKSLIFQKMYRGESMSEMREGSGLGLYLIKKYIEMMNGTVNMESKPGEGSVFTIALPTNNRFENIKKEEEDQETSGDKPKILVVEDNSQISGFLKDILKKSYYVVTAENGRSGLAIAGSLLPDLIIADEMMPVMTGIEMTKRLKENIRLATIPVIMLTAKDDHKTESESIKQGIDIFMSKPFEPATLLARIEQLIDKRKEIIEKLRLETIIENESKPIEAMSVTEKTIATIIKIIEENISDPDLNVEMLCHISGLSNKNLYRLIKKHIGKGPLEFIRTIRLRKASTLLEQKRFTVSEICYMVGFRTPSYFAKCFQMMYGVTPSEYVDRQK